MSTLEKVPTSVRSVVHSTRGQWHGPVTRLMSPSDLGQFLRPFVFLDYFDTQGPVKSDSFNMHPHSGIATITWVQEGSINYVDTSGEIGVLPQGGMEWMQAGGGAWHGGNIGETGRVRGFQLWVALPPDRELAEAESIYLSPDAIDHHGPAAVLLGHYGAASSPIRTASPMTYLAVKLSAGERWQFQPPDGQTVAWAAVGKGRLSAPESLDSGVLAVFDESTEAIDFHAEVDTEFVLGSAVKHPHDLVLGHYSVHTSAEALREGEGRIQRIGKHLREAGRLA
ncbi:MULTISPECIES: pirin family protein [Paraburkholderia]|uniref:pirin family protein n=1 Tax=Paraburkholderia TaxID=1822464 RepID=UPI00224D458F|nr:MULTISPECIES: pirin family protein [Paraburkholderia]MCX4163002.1 pirin family protein [Paraburkholderia megapolitana]MDN7158498.1 pirin family protein [Paraburkholderia sp. CHISQ3]MDQ6495545.1 pirin family protein [Paraburkholderia megapolitana]